MPCSTKTLTFFDYVICFEVPVVGVLDVGLVSSKKCNQLIKMFTFTTGGNECSEMKPRGGQRSEEEKARGSMNDLGRNASDSRTFLKKQERTTRLVVHKDLIHILYIIHSIHCQLLIIRIGSAFYLNSSIAMEVVDHVEGLSIE